jgi:3,4-dihydroxyphenylacetate 2,3-dioxygenase
MSGGLIASVVTPHTPRMGIESRAPEFVRGLIAGSRELGKALREMEPDLIILLSAHWVSTFNWFVTAHEIHEGFCVADEAPDLIPGVPYRYRGDPEFARALADTIQGAGLPGGLNLSPHYHWDYGSFVPLQYIDPDATIPVVTLPTVVCADLNECRAVGRLAHETAERLGRRAVFISSCALSHKLVRGPELWPSEALQALDRRLMDLLSRGRVGDLVSWAPEFCREAVAEMGGRTISGMIGAMEAMERARGPLHGRRIGPYAQSSGTGNATVCVTPVQA